MLPNSWLPSENLELNQVKDAPLGNFQSPDDTQEVSLTGTPTFSQAFDLGYFDVANLPASQENGFTLSMDNSQLSPDFFGSGNTIFTI